MKPRDIPGEAAALATISVDDSANEPEDFECNDDGVDGDEYLNASEQRLRDLEERLDRWEQQLAWVLNKLHDLEHGKDEHEPIPLRRDRPRLGVGRGRRPELQPPPPEDAA